MDVGSSAVVSAALVAGAVAGVSAPETTGSQATPNDPRSAPTFASF